MEYPNDEMRDYVVAFLNDALAADREAITELMFTRVKVNTQELVRPRRTIQVGPLNDYPGSSTAMSATLGLINGLCGAQEDTWGFIWRLSMPAIDKAKVDRFARLLTTTTRLRIRGSFRQSERIRATPGLADGHLVRTSMVIG